MNIYAIKTRFCVIFEAFLYDKVMPCFICISLLLYYKCGLLCGGVPVYHSFYFCTNIVDLCASGRLFKFCACSVTGYLNH